MTIAVRLPARAGLTDRQQLQRLTRAVLDEPLTRTTRRVSTDYTVQDSDDEVIGINTGTITVTLPSPSTVDGRQYTIIRASTGSIDIVATGGALLSGLATRTLATQWDTLTLKAMDTTGVGGFVYVIL